MDETAKKEEIFTVATATSLPLRTIYWTDAGFDGPVVQIKDPRVTTVAPLTTARCPRQWRGKWTFPAARPRLPISTHFTSISSTARDRSMPTTWRVSSSWSNFGEARPGGVYEYLGRDIIQIKREPEVERVVRNLGTELIPRVPAQPGDELLEASAPTSAAQGASGFYGTSVRPDGSLVYHAEREPAPPTIRTTAPRFPPAPTIRWCSTGWSPRRIISASSGRNSSPATGSAGPRNCPTMFTTRWTPPAAPRTQESLLPGAICRSSSSRMTPRRRRR